LGHGLESLPIPQRRRLDAEADAVFRVLERPDRYPQFREVRQTGDTGAVLRFRSVLPYDLTVTARSTRHDTGDGVLEVAVTGDLEGWVRWTVRAGGSAEAGGDGDRGTRLLFGQDVVVRKALMRVFAVPCRPIFRVNHALMMRGGRLGLLARPAADVPHLV
jgi:hypothetical protein